MTLKERLKKRIKARKEAYKEWKKKRDEKSLKEFRKHKRATRYLRYLIKKATFQKPISLKGANFIADFEGFLAYPDSSLDGVPTVGIGETEISDLSSTGGTIDGKYYTWPLSEKDARKIFLKKLNKKYAPATKRFFEKGGSLHGKSTQARRDALVSFVYNLGIYSVDGIPGFETIGRALESGVLKNIGDAFLLYDKSGGRALPGLTRRRNAERLLFLSGNYHNRYTRI